ncbi:MAG: hypothetical protein WBG37_14200 [Desulfobacterales bacterium]|jgi:hypothetical protein
MTATHALQRGWLIIVCIGVLLLGAACDSGSDGSAERDGWELAQYDDTDVIPNVGNYEFSATGCFEVRQDPELDQRILFYASDCFNYRRMEIVNGTFYGIWGDIDGTQCPEDSFGISGHFNTPRTAVGTVKYARDCAIFESLEFTANQ